MDICVLTDFDGNHQGLIPITASRETFKEELIKYVSQFYIDCADIKEVAFSDRFWKYEPVEAKFAFVDEDGEDFFHLNIQLSGVTTPQKHAYKVDLDGGVFIGVILAETAEELHDKLRVAVGEEFAVDEIQVEVNDVVKGFPKLGSLDWGNFTYLPVSVEDDWGGKERTTVKVTKTVIY
jgi:hypothetical protein